MSLDIVLVTDVLAPNLSLTDITYPTDDAVAFDGVNVWAGGNIQDVSFDLIEVGTNELGQIDQWHIVVDGAGPLTGYTLTTSWDGTTGSTVISDGLLAENLNDPGSWSEVSPTPEPATGVDLALGLLALGALLIGKRRVAQAPRK
jgi:MYXO-CTERM domain-containing protein